MKIKRIEFRNYKVLQNSQFIFDNHLTQIREKNEYGKSTIIEGVKDLFSFRPDQIVNKRTSWKSEAPYIAMEFEMNNSTYTLEVNAQDGTVRLTGENDIIRTNVKGIKRFFEENGLKFLPDLVSGLMVIRERDMSINTRSRNLSDFINSVFKTRDIEKLDGLIKNIVGRKIPLKGSFGTKKRELQELLTKIDIDIDRLYNEINEYETNLKELERIKKLRGKLELELKDLREELEKREIMFEYKKFNGMEEEKERIRKQIEELKKKLEEIKKKLREKENEKRKKEDENKKLITEISKIEYELKTLNERRNRVKKLREKVRSIEEKLREKEDLKNRLGKFASEDVESLEEARNTWKIFLTYQKNSGGIIEIIDSKGEVSVNDNKLRQGYKVNFKGIARVAYKDLVMKIYPVEKLSELEKNIDKYNRNYGNVKNLERVIRELRKLNNLKDLLDKEDNIEELRNEIKEIENTINAENILNNKLVELKKKHEVFQGELSNITGEVNSLQKDIGKYENEIINLSKKLANIEEFFKEHRDRYEILLEKVTKKMERDYGEVDLIEFEKRINELKEMKKKQEEQFNELRITESNLAGKLEKIPERDRLERLQSEKQKIMEQIGSLDRMEIVLKYTEELLSRIREKLNERYLLNFSQIVSGIFNKITDGEYDGVEFDVDSIFFDADSFVRKWKVKHTSRGVFTVDELSDGTKSQLLLSARLALLQLFFKKPLFLFLDEPFAYFDKKREKNALELLENLSKNENWQIIIMSAKE